MEESRCYSKISERSSTKLVAISRVACDLFQAEIFILSRPLEDDVARFYAEDRGNLRNADDALLKVGEHLVRLAHRRAAGHGVTLHTLGLAEEEKRAAFFGRSHGFSVSACKLVNGCVGIHLREFEFSDGFAKHEEVDRCSGFDLRKHFAKQSPVGRASVENR